MIAIKNFQAGVVGLVEKFKSKFGWKFQIRIRLKIFEQGLVDPYQIFNQVDDSDHLMCTQTFYHL